MDKKIELIFSANTAEIDKKLNELTQKMQRISAPAQLETQANQLRDKMARLGIGGGATDQDKMREEQAKQKSARELEQFTKQQMKMYDALKEKADKYAKTLKSLNEEKERLVKLGKSTANIDQRIGGYEKLYTTARQGEVQRGQLLSDLKGGQQGGEGGITGGGNMVGSLMQGLKAAGFFAAINQVNKIASSIGSYSTRNEQMQAAGAQAEGRVATNMMSGETAFEESLYSPERSASKHENKSKAERAGRMLSSGLDIVTNTLPGQEGPGLGSLLTSEGRKSISDYFAKQNYDKEEQERQARIQQDPFREHATKEFNRTYMRDAHAQKMLGMDNLREKGGYYDTLSKKGFLQEQGLAASQQILSAGGSTDMAQNSVTALQANRQFNMMNAGGMLGQLSGSVGSAKQSESQFVKIMSQGVMLGLNNSNLAREQEKFNSLVTDMVVGSGAKSAESAEAIAAGFAQTVSDPTTMKGLQDAASVRKELDANIAQGGALAESRILAGTTGEQAGLLKELMAFESQEAKEAYLLENEDVMKDYEKQFGVSGKEEVLKDMRSRMSRGQGSDNSDLYRRRMELDEKIKASGKSLDELPPELQEEKRALERAELQTAKTGSVSDYRRQQQKTDTLLSSGSGAAVTKGYSDNKESGFDFTDWVKKKLSGGPETTTDKRIAAEGAREGAVNTSVNNLSEAFDEASQNMISGSQKLAVALDEYAKKIRGGGSREEAVADVSQAMREAGYVAPQQQQQIDKKNSGQ